MELFSEIFIAWLLFAAVQLAATMSPGPAFAVAVRNAMAYGRRGGVFTALGFGVGIGVHVVFVLCGLAVILSQSVVVFNVIKYVGAAYLIYIGAKALMMKKAKSDHALENVSDKRLETISAFKAFQIGFWTNVLNPKAVVFFSAVFTQFIQPGSPVEILVLYGATSIFIEMAWFSGLSVVLTTPKVKAVFVSIGHWIERACGGLLVLLGVRLALSKM